MPDSNKKQLDIYNFNGELIESKTMSNTINTPFIVKNMQTIIYSTTTSEHNGDTGFTNYYRRLNILDLPSGNSLVVSKDFGTGSRSSESFSPDKTITDIDKERFMTIYSYSYTDSFGSNVVRYCSIYDAKNLTCGGASSSSKGISSPAGGQINFICAPNDKTFIKMMTLYK